MSPQELAELRAEADRLGRLTVATEPVPGRPGAVRLAPGQFAIFQTLGRLQAMIARAEQAEGER